MKVNKQLQNLYKTDKTLSKTETKQKLQDGGEYLLAFDTNGDKKVDVMDIFSWNNKTDINGDGMISQDEYSFNQRLLNMLDDKISAGLLDGKDKDLYDINGDGKIDKKDYETFMKKYEGSWLENNYKTSKTGKIIQEFKEALQIKTNQMDVSDELKLLYKNDKTLSKSGTKEAIQSGAFYNALDVNGDNVADIKDVLAWANKTDIDGDGKVSDEEWRFNTKVLNQLVAKVDWRMDNYSDAKNYDINGDGKVNASDYVLFENLIDGSYYDTNNPEGNAQKLVSEFRAELKKVALDKTGDGKVDAKDMAQAEQFLAIAKDYIAGKNDANNISTFEYLSNDKIKEIDQNGDGKITQTDVTMLQENINALKKSGIKSTAENDEFLKAQKNNVEKYTNQLKEKDKNIQDLNNAVSYWDRENKSLYEQVQTQKLYYQESLEKLNNLKKQKTEWEKKLAEAKKKDPTGLSKECREAEKQLIDIRAELQIRQNHTDNHKKKLDALTKQKAAALKTLNQKKNELEKAKQSASEIQEKLTTAKNSVNYRSNLQTEMSNVKNNVKNEFAQDAKNNKQRVFSQEIQDLNNAISYWDRENKSLYEQVQTQKLYYQESVEKLNNLKKQKAEWEKKLAESKKKDPTGLSKECREAEKQLIDIRAELQIRQKHTDNHKKKLDALTKQKAAAFKTLNDKKAELNKLK